MKTLTQTTGVIIARNPETVSELAIYWLITYARARKAASSIKRDHGVLKNYILPTFGKLKASELLCNQVEGWLSELVMDRGLSQKSVNDILIIFRKILNDAVRWNFLKENPLLKIPKFKIVEKDMFFWKQEDVLQFLGMFIGDKKPPRIFWPAAIGLYTGLRRGEIQALRWDDINWKTKMITIKRSYCRIKKEMKEETKSKLIRHIPISIALAALLQRIKNTFGEKGYIVPFFQSDAYNREFGKLCLQMNLPKIRFHDLRHTFASNFMMGGGNIYDLQKILGHSTIQVTERYSHLAPTHLQGKTEVLGF